MRLMRTLAAFVLLMASAAHGQDLQYTMVMHMTVPGMEGMATPEPKMTVFQHGNAMRVDNEMPMLESGPMRMSVIMDMTARKSYMIQHALKTYMEMPSPLALPDSIMKAQKLTEPRVVDTGEVEHIGAYDGHRVIMAMESLNSSFPLAAPKDGMKLAMLMEAWLSTDPTLNAAHKRMAAAMVGNANDPFAQMLAGQSLEGFPLRIRMTMRQVPKDAVPEPVALSKSADDSNLVMRMTMEVSDIKIAPLDPALFQVPAGYRKTN